jgi:diguanylate cyclase (GGDEF)-like protein
MKKDELIKENIKLKEEIEELRKQAQRAETRKRIIARVNQMLDQSLYELSVINKINRILTKTLDYEEIIREIMALLSTMVEYVAAGLLISDDTVCLLKIHLASPRARKFIMLFKERAIRKYAELSGTSLSSDKLLLGVENEAFIVDSEERGNLLGAFEAARLQVADRVIGILCVAHTKTNIFTSADLKLIELLANTSSVAIENGLLHRKVEELAITDGLTGVYNHRYFKEALHRELRRSQRYNLVFSLLILDIDNFKKINDTYGHIKGDEVLKGLANIAKGNLHREIDVLARYGGEEFVVILPQTTKERAVFVADRMRREIEDRLSGAVGMADRITVSVGIAQYPHDGEEERMLIQSADQALYQAKKSGKNRVVMIQNNNAK